MLPSSRHELVHFVGFVAAGGAATVLNYGVFFGLFTAGVYYTLASMIGYVSGIAVSFVINVRFVFRSSIRGNNRSLRYFSLYLVALVVQLALLEVFVRSGFYPEIANAIAIAVVVMLNFFAMRKWVFPAGEPISPKSSDD